MDIKMKNLLKKYNLEPKAHLDQHFLVNENVIDEVVGLLDTDKKDTILEIGAGIGTITKRIKGCKKLIAVEIDETLGNILKNEIKNNKDNKNSINIKNIEIINDNILKIIDDIEFNKIISSTPYAICEPLVQKLFFLDFEKAVLLFPKKFVDNVKDEKTKLGMITQAFLDIKVIKTIDKKDFFPSPKVETLIVVVTKNKKDSFLKQLYLQKDKKLKNALMNILINDKNNKKITKKQAKEKIKSMNINEKTLDERIPKLKKQDYDDLIKKGKPFFP